jgi:hypothetical protein
VGGAGPANGNGHTTIVSSVTRLAHSLPSQFLALLVLNGVMLGLLFWFVDARARHTVEIMNHLLDACLKGH